MNKQSTFFSKKIQEIHAKPSGEIFFSSNTIFDISENEDLYSLHPFFESLKHELEKEGIMENSLAFPCVQLEVHGKEAICDVTIKKELDFLAILLFDYSQHYEHLHEAAQEKKSAMLLEKEHELKLKYSSEKAAYLDFIRERLDTKLISEMEEAVRKIEQLKRTSLTPEQRQNLQEIEEIIGGFHLKAIQVREGLDFDFDT
ncbi:hypothetical protein POV27_18295 [Aureisphaera galaxeae]|uniref:hypothetical protein n=1 Tax=Aureisphaera galaxeae TaxID=1538023 RepID=UPI00234FEC71|nr:hypothetical protein [Aureisphaera galaxeae]MDC8006008.1 hypothetical protein [Aureisphaera galaxeae]